MRIEKSHMKKFEEYTQMKNIICVCEQTHVYIFLHTNWCIISELSLSKNKIIITLIEAFLKLQLIL